MYCFVNVLGHAIVIIFEAKRHLRILFTQGLRTVHFKLLWALKLSFMNNTLAMKSKTIEFSQLYATEQVCAYSVYVIRESILGPQIAASTSFINVIGSQK